MKMRSKRNLVLKAFFQFLLFSTLLVECPKPCPAEELPILGTVPAFSFQDEHGDSYGLKDLDGQVWVADFFFSNCHMTCPLQSAYLSELQKKWPKRKDFKIVSFTVDPGRDTVAALAQYAVDYQANTQRWHFLTGRKRALYTLIQKGFKVTAAVDNSTGIPDFIHTTRMALVDGQGNIRGYYDSMNTDDQKQLESDLKQLLERN